MNNNEYNKLVNIIAALPDFINGENSRRVLIESAGLKRFLSGIDIAGNPRTVAGDLIGRLENFGPLPELSTHHVLGALLNYMLDELGDLPQENAKFIATLIIKEALVTDDKYIKKLCEKYSIKREKKPSTTPPQPRPDNPYRGLAAFREQDAANFFGRETDIDDLQQAAQDNTFVAVVGSSGSGKSSLVFAGLVPRLRQTNSWLIADFRPQNRPFSELAQALIPPLYLGELELVREASGFVDGFDEGSIKLSTLVQRILKKNPDKRLLLIADQFEELYTLNPDKDLQRRFIDRLLEAVSTFPPLAKGGETLVEFTLLLTIRADFMGYALDYGDFATVLDTHPNKILGPITDETQLRRIIEEPAHKLGISLEPDLAERILQEVNQQKEVSLPLLEFTLTQLWDKQTNGQLTHAAYGAIGGVDQALSEYANTVYARFKTTEEKEKLHRIFVQLVRPGEGTEDTRQVATREQVGGDNWDNLVKQLADARLVVTRRNEKTGQETIEVVHEALIHHWQPLRNWINEYRQFRVWQNGLRYAVEAWDNADKDEGSLLRGARLTEAEEKLSERAEEMNGSQEKQYIEASIKLKERKIATREQARRRIIRSLITFSVLAMGLASVAGWQWWEVQQREEKLTKNLTEIERLHQLTEQRKNLLASALDFTSTGVLYNNVGQYQKALEYYQKVLVIRQKMGNPKGEAAELSNIGTLYSNSGQYEKALEHYQQAVAISREINDRRGESAGVSNIGTVYNKLGQYQKALNYYQQALTISKEIKDLMRESTDILNMGVLYQNLGNLDKALPLLEKSYRIRQEILGGKHPDTLISLNNLGTIYQALGRLDEAFPLYKRVYNARKEVLGEKHPQILSSLANLADIYIDLGHLKDALPLAEKSYILRNEILGEKHPDTLQSLNNLAGIYQALGRFSETLPLFENGYRLRKEVLGEKHPNTLTSLDNLAGIYEAIGRLSEALPLFEKGYRLRQELLGDKHPDTLTSLNHLAGIYQALGRFSDALPLYGKGYRLRKEVLGEKHPNTLTSLNNLAGIYQALGRLSKALPLYEKGYRLRKEVLGEKHPNTLTSLNNLAGIYEAIGRFYDALPLYEKGYRLRQELLGNKHPDTLTSLNKLAGIYQALGRLEEALPLFEKADHLRKDILGDKHPDALISLNNLGAIYQTLGRLDDALSLFEKGYNLHKEVLGEKHPNTLSNLNNLAWAYADKEATDKAIRFFEKLVDGVESLRSGDLSAEDRQALFKQWIPSYFKLSQLYLLRDKGANAFRMAEMLKARTLLESMTMKLPAQNVLSQAEQQQLQDYKARLAFLKNRIAKALENNRLEETITLETEKNQLVNKLNKFNRELMAKYPKYVQLSKVQIIGAKEGAKYLPADAVLISYRVHENHVLAFTLQADGKLTAHNLGEIPDLEKDLETYRRRLSSLRGGRGQVRLFEDDKKDTQSLSKKLGKRLLEPLKDIIKDKPYWIISIDGPLALIPFETLRWEEQLVITQHKISYVLSLSILKLLQERQKFYLTLKNRGTLLAIGAPLYDDSGTSNIRTKELPFQELSLKWHNLPGALEELEQLKKLFKKTQPRIYKQADATEAQLQSLNKQGILAKYRYLVFSAHGYLSPQAPALSSVVLGQVNNPQGIDGYVTATEIAGYDLKSDLVVLSACKTGPGQIMPGEGVMGLPYAFYNAGNINTLITLWSISDEITTEFITSFFAKLKQGKDQVNALTATKREFLKKGGRHSNPMYWAPFVLYGM